MVGRAVKKPQKSKKAEAGDDWQEVDAHAAKLAAKHAKQVWRMTYIFFIYVHIYFQFTLSFDCEACRASFHLLWEGVYLSPDAAVCFWAGRRRRRSYSWRRHTRCATPSLL